MLKRFNMLALIILLVFQTMVAPVAATAQGINSDKAPEPVLKDGVFVDEEEDSKDGEEELSSTRTVEFEWTLNEEVEIGEIYTANIPGESTVEQEQAGELTFDEEEVGLFSVTKDGVAVIEFDEAIEGLPEAATGTFEVEVVVEEDSANPDANPDPLEEIDEKNNENPIDGKQDSEETEDTDNTEIPEVDSEDTESDSEVELEAYDKAKAAVEIALQSKKTKDIEAAQKLIAELKDEEQQKELRKQLAELEKPQKKNGVQVLNDSEDPEHYYFNLTESTLTDLSGAAFDENNLFDPDGEFKLTVKWELEDGHGWKEEKEITIVLPEQIKYDAGTTINLPDSSGAVVATVTFGDSNEATLKFTNYIEQANEVSGEFQIIAKIDQDNVEEENGYIEVDAVGEEGSHRIPISMVDRKKDVQKQGVPNNKYEAEHIDWTVTVNSGRMKLDGASITDVLPDGVEYVENSLEVYEQTLSVNGKNVLSETKIEGKTPTIDGQKLTVELGDINKQYIVEYQTKITDEDKKEFKNKVSLDSDDDIEVDPAIATVQVTRGEPLTKQSTADFNPVDGTASWKIEFNYNKKDLTGDGGVTLEDTWTVNPFREMVLDGDITFTEMEIDGNGDATPKEGGTAPIHGDVTPKLNGDGEQIGFEIPGIQTDKPYEITYTTKIDGRILEALEISNMAGFGPDQTSGVGPGEIGRYYGTKKPGKINYADKTIPWTIQLNQDNYPMGNIRIKDTLGPGLSLVDDNFDIKVGGQPYTGDNPIVTKSGQEFTLTFPEDFVTEEIVDITYQTTFIPDKVTDYTPTNKATIYWTPGADGDEQSGDVSAKTEFRPEVENYSWKNASYNAATKEITWEMIVNYRENEFTNLRIVDELQGDEVLEPYDFEVYELSIDKDGEYTKGDKLQDVNPEITGKSFELVIGKTSKAYKITYKTSLENLSEITKQYVNKANVYDGDKVVNEGLTATAGIYEDQKYGNKSGSQENNSKFADWQILVNLAQEKIVDLELIDTASSNQEYLPHTIKVYETKFEDGEAVKDETNPLDPNKYEVTVTEAATPNDAPSFTLKWIDEVDRPYVVEYSTIFFAEHGGEIFNSYEIKGNNKTLSGEDKETGSSVKIRQTASGSASGKAGRLIVQKKDTSYDFSTGNKIYGVLEGIQFEVQDLSGRKIKEGTTNAEGEIDFGRLLYGDYKLVEIEESMKPGYIAPELERIIKINKDYSDVKEDHTVEFDNYEAIFAVELTKVDSVDAGRKLVNAEFAIYHSEGDASSNTNPIMTARTNEDGYIMFNLAEAQPNAVKKAGTYYVKEITSPDKYQDNDKVYPVTISDKEREPKKLGNIKNTLYPGKGELRKVDSLRTNGDIGDLVGLSGATFAVYDVNTTEVDRFTTNAEGIGITKDLPPGTYTVKEITAPTGFTASTETFYLTIPEANATETYRITAQGESTRVDVFNAVEYTNIEVTKQDAENEKQKIEGVTFEIVAYDGSEYGNRYTNIASSLKNTTATTGPDGKATFENVPPGTYSLKEVDAPADYGFILDDTEFDVVVTHNQVGPGTIVTEPRTNKPLAKVTLRKVDSESAYRLAGVEFTLWKDGVQITDHYNQEFKTNGSGEIVITGLAPGEYELREADPPTGYKKQDGNGSIRSFTVPELTALKNPNETEQIDFISVDNEGAVKNAIVKGSITIQKVDGDKETDNALQGVEFTIKAKSLEKVNNDGYLATYNSENETNFTKPTNGDGEVTFENLRPGIYEIKETEALEGYQSYWGTIPDAEVNLQDEAHEVKLENDNAIENFKERTLTVTKEWNDLDESLRPDEITVQLVRKVGNGEFTSLNPPETLIIKKSEGWTGEFPNLDAVNGNGEVYTYSVQEISEEGYTSEVSETVIDSTEKDKQSVTLTNTANTTKIELTKTDSISGALIDGAKFELTNPKGTTTEQTTVDGKLSFENLQPGTYTLKEIGAAPGYILNSEEKTITIENADVAGDGDVTKVVEFENNPLAKVMILKQDVDSKAPLNGAQFRITGDNDFEKTVTTDKEGQVIVTGLPAGEYTLEEITPPSGYSKHNNDNDKRTFTVQAGETKTIDHDFTAEDGALNEGSFKNSIITGSVKLLKFNNGNEPMENVDFTLTASELDFAGTDYVTTYNASLANPYKTGSDGQLEISDLRPGKYTLIESIPAGYQDDYVGNGLGDKRGTFEFTIVPAGENETTATEVKLGIITNYALTTIEVSKIWKDEDVTDRVITDQKIYLERNIAGGTKEVVQSVELENTNKTYIFGNLPVVDKYGKDYEYSVREDEVPGYATLIDDFTITNTRSENITISGEKTWTFGEGGKQYLPDEITVKLFKGKDDNKEEVTTETVEADEDGNWEYEFTNQPRFDTNGIEIEYSIEEVDVPGFTSEVNEFKITNTQEKTDVEVTKVWDEVEPQYRPEKITLQVKNGNIIVDTFELTGDKSSDEWSHKFTNLPKYDKTGNKIDYTVDEVVPAGYEKTIAGNEMTNTQIVTEVPVTKKWVEEDSRYRPKEITLQVKIGDVVYESHTLEGDAEDDEWSYTFTNLPKFDADGTEIQYTVDEAELAGYDKSITGNVITNTQQTVDIPVTKKWNEVNADYRPDEITVQVKIGNVVYKDHKLSGDQADAEWSYTFKNLPEFDAKGKEILYTIDEVTPTGYEKSIDAEKNTITNTQKTINISGTKTWKDEEDTSARPDEDGITVQVMKVNDDDTKTDVVSDTVKPDDGEWTYEFINLPKYDKAGEEITYIINELNVPGYVAEIDEYNITNTRTAKTDISVTKQWLDEDANDRPDSITVQLYQNNEKYKDEVKIEPDTDDNWTHTYEDLDQFNSEGKAYTYTIKEVEVDEKYEAQEPQWIAEDNGFTITNVRTGTTTIEGMKTWLDEGNPDRPESIEIGVYRSVEGDENPTLFETETIESNNSSEWAYSFDYTAFNDEGKEYTYSVDEVVPESYQLKAKDDFNFTNVRVGKTDITVTKAWDHKKVINDLPTEIEVDLFRSIQNGEKEQVNDLETPYTLTESTDWTLPINNLPEFDENGNQYTYEVKERIVAEYNSEVADNGLDITNTRKTYAIGDYVWIDRNKDGIQDENEQPLEGVTVELYKKDGKETIATTATDKNGKYIFDELVSGDYQVKFTLTDEQSKKYKFTQQTAEKDSTADSDADENGWTTEISLNEENEQLTKDYKDQTFEASEGIDPIWDAGVIELVDISGVKTWKDDNDDEAIAARPGSITVQLLANKNEVDTTTVTALDWNYTFTGLDKYDTEGKEIEYTIDEKAVEGYKKSIDGFNLTNTRTGTTEVKVTKDWLDADDAEQPEEVTVELYQNDSEEAFKTEKVAATDDWTYTFKGLPKYDSEGKSIEYSVKEVDLDEKYQLKEITGDQENGFTITNIRSGETSVTIDKQWKDENALDRPETIKVNLLQNDTVLGEHSVKAENKWKLTIDNLPEFDDEGKPYTYTISEHDVAGYESQVDGLTITNTRSDKKDIDITKIWLDDESKDRPTEINVDLFRSIEKGEKEKVDTYPVTTEGDWKLTIEDLPSFDQDGKAYTYEIVEHEPDGYQSKVNGFDITNLRVGTIEVSGKKTWNEVDEQYRPDEVTIQLLANEKAQDTTKASVPTDWTYEFKDLAKYDDQGKLITYTVEEVNIPNGYESEVKGFNITNTQEKTEVTGTKTWIDQDEEARPESITVQVKKGDNVIKEQDITSDVTAFTFTDLPKYDKSGKEIKYTVDEKVISEYNKSIDGLDITNTQKTYAIGDYVWIDRNKDGIQDENEKPLEGVTVELYDKDGKKPIAITTTDENGKYIFDELVSGDYQVKFILTEEQAKKYKFTQQNAGEKPAVDSDADKNGWTTDISLNENNKQLMKDYKDQTFEASEGIDPTWGAGVIELVDISGTKTWKDDNSDERPAEITVKLLANDEEMKTATIKGPDWNYAFTGLDQYDTDGKEIKYTIDEEEVKGYKKFIEGHDLTNVRIGKTTINLTKVWKDDHKADRPGKVTVNVLANGNVTGPEYEVTAENDWKLTINDLAKYDTEGKEIDYTISEHDVPGYELEEITGNVKDGFTITNVRTEEKSITIEKSWIGDERTKLPDKIDVELFRSIVDGNKESVHTYTVTAANDWTLTIDKLPSFDENGKAYTYEIEEETVAEYNQSVHGFQMTNIRKTYAIGDYVWIDRNKDGIQDENEKPLKGVTVELYEKDGKNPITTTTTDKNGRYIFDELVSGDYQVKFTLTDEQAKQYKFTQQNAGDKSTVDSDANKNGWTTDISLNEKSKQLTKEYKDQTFKASEGIDPTWDAGVIELVDIPITKYWNDKDQSIRPDSITVNLLANDKDASEYTITAKNNWTLTIVGLDKYDTNGKEIAYTITEQKVSEYNSTVDQFDITNTRKTYAISDYVWIDRNKNGIQDENEELLEGVIVELFDKDGKRLKTTTTNKDGLYIFDELESGEYKVKFTLTEEQAKKYEFTKQSVGEDSVIDSKPDETGWTKVINLNENNKHLTKDYERQDFNASEGIDPTWDAGVIEKVIPEEPTDPQDPENPSLGGEPGNKDPENPKVVVSEGKIPKTATNMYNLALIGLGLMLLGLIIFLTRRKRIE